MLQHLSTSWGAEAQRLPATRSQCFGDGWKITAYFYNNGSQSRQIHSWRSSCKFVPSLHFHWPYSNSSCAIWWFFIFGPIFSSVPGVRVLYVISPKTINTLLNELLFITKFYVYSTFINHIRGAKNNLLQQWLGNYERFSEDYTQINTYLCGFSPRTLVSSHSPITCTLGVSRLTGHSKSSVGVNVSEGGWLSLTPQQDCQDTVVYVNEYSTKTGI